MSPPRLSHPGWGGRGSVTTRSPRSCRSVVSRVACALPRPAKAKGLKTHFPPTDLGTALNTEKRARGSISPRGQGTIPTQYIGLKTRFPPTVDLHWRTNLITFVTFVAPIAAIGLVRLHWRHGECMGNISENT